MTDDPKPHLVTLGFTPALREATRDLDATHVEVDLTTEKTVDQYLLDVVDAASLYPEVVVAVGPLTFGWACSGQLSDLRGWSQLHGDSVRIAVCPEGQDRQTYEMSSEVYARLGADVGLMLLHDDPQSQAMAWLVEHTQASA